MDLRDYNPTCEQLSEAVHLACKGLLCYQPFIFSNNFATGAGYEFANHAAEGSGFVYCGESIPEKYIGSEGSQRYLIDSSLKQQFFEDNQRLRLFYESMIDLAVSKLGDVSNLTAADVGCCSGYFPLALAKRGFCKVVGYDRVNYTDTFKLLNSILGTTAEFRHQPYIGKLSSIEQLGDECFDLISSIAVLVHLSDPLQHLACLGRMARKALLVWTTTVEDGRDELVLKYRSINRYYDDQEFPYCFDTNEISPSLLKQSLKLMGFSELYEIKNFSGGMPNSFFNQHIGYLAIRDKETPFNIYSYSWSDTKLPPVPKGQHPPKLIQGFPEYSFNLVKFKGQFFGIPYSLGNIDLSKIDIKNTSGLNIDNSEQVVRQKILKSRPPILVTSLDEYGFNIVSFGGEFFGVPYSLGSIDISQIDSQCLDKLIIESSENAVRERIKTLVDRPLRLVSSLDEFGFSIFSFEDRFFGIPYLLDSIDISESNLNDLKGVIVDDSEDKVRQRISEISLLLNEIQEYLRDEKQRLQDEKQQLQDEILEMKRSKFWLLRNKWFKFKGMFS